LTVENILNRQIAPKSPSKVWVSDITYIHTKEKFLYLTTIIDLYDRKIIGWRLTTQGAHKTPYCQLGEWQLEIEL
jgi:putative transposase